MQEHRHAAIMPACHSYGQCTAGKFTDIVGYIALMGDQVLRNDPLDHSYQPAGRLARGQLAGEINNILDIEFWISNF